MKDALEIYKRIKFKFRAPNLSEIVSSSVKQLKNVFDNIDIQIDQLQTSIPFNVNHVNRITLNNNNNNNNLKEPERAIVDSTETLMKDVQDTKNVTDSIPKLIKETQKE